MKRLAIVSTHPIQYNAPFFKKLTERKKISCKVFYTWSQAIEQVEDQEFGFTIQWDLPLLEGYEFQIIPNISKNPSSKQFGGMVNPGLRKAIQEFKPDAILVYGWNLKSHLDAIRYFSGKVPVFFRGDSTLRSGKTAGIKGFLRNLVLRWVYHYVDKAFYAGERNKAYFLAHGLKPDQLIFMPHAVDNDRFFSALQERKKEIRDLKKKLSIDEETLVFLYAGKIVQRKNSKGLAEAFKLYAAENPNARLIMAGDGAKKEIVMQSTRDCQSIIHLPFQNQNQMPVLLAIADVVILPSVSGETWGLIINEAMAVGKAVLVSDRVGCAPDLVRQGENGFVFSLDKEKDLLKTLRAFKKETVKTMGKKSQEIIQGFSYERDCEVIENTLI